MSKTDNYEISDSLWGRTTQYASSVWESWGKDVDEYVEDVMDTDARSDEELYGSTVLQDSAHSVELVAHLVGSVFSNDYTKERMEELGSIIASTQSYQSAKETMGKLDHTLTQATEQFMQEHPKVQTAFMATEDKLEEVTAYVTKEAKEFSTNHPEITHNLKAIVEIAAIIPAVKARNIVVEAEELSKLNKLDYEHTQGKELAKGIPSDVDKKSLNLEKIEVTAEAKIGKEALFDTNQKGRAEAHPKTPALRHDEIRAKEANIKLKNDREINIAEQNGNPKPQEEIDKMRSRESKPNATLAQSHAETAVIQKAFEQGLTKDADMFIKVNGKEVCGHCNSDTIAMAKESGLKSITIHDYNAIDKKNPEKPIIYWEQGMSKRDRFDSFEDLKKAFPDSPQAPDHIKYAGVLETERTSMNKMDMMLLGAGGVVLMNEGVAEEKSLDQEVLEQRVDPQTYETIHQSKVQDIQSNEAPFNTTTQAQKHIDRLYPHLASSQTQSENTRDAYQTEENGYRDNNLSEYSEIPNLRSTYDNGLPDSVNAYLDQFKPDNSYAYENDVGMDID